MPFFITQGRFTQEALRGMLARPEDRGEAVAKLFAATGGKLLSCFMTFGDYDFLVVSEGPDEGVVTSSIISGLRRRRRSQDDAGDFLERHEECIRQGGLHRGKVQGGWRPSLKTGSRLAFRRVFAAESAARPPRSSRRVRDATPHQDLAFIRAKCASSSEREAPANPAVMP